MEFAARLRFPGKSESTRCDELRSLVDTRSIGLAWLERSYSLDTHPTDNVSGRSHHKG